MRIKTKISLCVCHSDFILPLICVLVQSKSNTALFTRLNVECWTFAPLLRACSLFGHSITYEHILIVSFSLFLSFQSLSLFNHAQKVVKFLPTFKHNFLINVLPLAFFCFNFFCLLLCISSYLKISAICSAIAIISVRAISINIGRCFFMLNVRCYQFT